MRKLDAVILLTGVTELENEITERVDLRAVSPICDCAMINHEIGVIMRLVDKFS